jgi:hypothetical protein
MYQFASPAEKVKADFSPHPVRKSAAAPAPRRTEPDGIARSDHDFGRIAVNSAEKKAGALKTWSSAGGLRGFHMNVTYSVSDTKATSLQAVQTAMATGGRDIGPMQWMWDKKKWTACVDGGKNSPWVTQAGHAPAHPTKPYYLDAAEVAADVKWSGNSGTIRISDVPDAGTFEELHFETAIVGIDAAGPGKDKILNAFKWGWKRNGSRPDVKGGDTINGVDSGIRSIGSVTPEFKNIVKNDYPGYDYV